MLDSFICFYIEIIYSNFTSCGAYLLSFLTYHTISAKRAHPGIKKKIIDVLAQKVWYKETTKRRLLSLYPASCIFSPITIDNPHIDRSVCCAGFRARVYLISYITVAPRSLGCNSSSIDEQQPIISQVLYHGTRAHECCSLIRTHQSLTGWGIAYIHVFSINDKHS